MDPDVSADDSFYEMTYNDTSSRQVHAQRLANDKANFTLFMDKVCVCVAVMIEFLCLDSLFLCMYLVQFLPSLSPPPFLPLPFKVSQLDGVPLLLRSADTVNTIPDERVTATFLAHLCARLLDLTVEIKAARVLQVAWRRRLAQRRLQELRVKYEWRGEKEQLP